MKISTNKSNNKSKAKKVICATLSIAAICTGVLGLTGCNNDNNSTMKQVVLCTPAKDSGNDEYIELILGKDGKTVEQASIRKYTDLDTLKKQVKESKYTSLETEDGETYSLKEDSKAFYEVMYESAADTYENFYYIFTAKNTKYSWFSYTLNENETDKTAELILSFDFTDKTFKFDDKTIDFLQYCLPFKWLYNEDEQRLEYKEGAIEKYYKASDLDNSCSVSQTDQSKTYHHKAVIQLKKANEKAKKLNSK